MALVTWCAKNISTLQGRIKLADGRYAHQKCQDIQDAKNKALLYPATPPVSIDSIIVHPQHIQLFAAMGYTADDKAVLKLNEIKLTKVIKNVITAKQSVQRVTNNIEKVRVKNTILGLNVHETTANRDAATVATEQLKLLNQEIILLKAVYESSMSKYLEVKLEIHNKIKNKRITMQRQFVTTQAAKIAAYEIFQANKTDMTLYDNYKRSRVPYMESIHSYVSATQMLLDLHKLPNLNNYTNTTGLTQTT